MRQQPSRVAKKLVQETILGRPQDDFFASYDYFTLGEKVVLRPTEYRLLYHLVSNAGRLLTHETLLSKVWGSEYRDEAHYLRLYITYLRQKIEKDPAHPHYILTERGVGYRFKELGE